MHEDFLEHQLDTDGGGSHPPAEDLRQPAIPAAVDLAWMHRGWDAHVE